jgi:hypothetical protein
VFQSPFVPCGWHQTYTENNADITEQTRKSHYNSAGLSKVAMQRLGRTTKLSGKVNLMKKKFFHLIELLGLKSLNTLKSKVITKVIDWSK